MNERRPNSAPDPTEPDAYAVLGLSPDADDVVVRSAYRSLMAKFAAGGAEAIDDTRARNVQAAYDLLKDPVVRRAYDAYRRGEPPTGPEGSAQLPPAERLTMRPADADDPPSVAAAPARQRPWLVLLRRRGAREWPVPTALGAALALLLVTAGIAAVMFVFRPGPGPAQSGPGLDAGTQAAAGDPHPLPCFVDGHSVGELPLAACAAQGGVARGRLEVGVVPAEPAAPVALPAPQTPTPAAAPPAADATSQTQGAASSTADAPQARDAGAYGAPTSSPAAPDTTSPSVDPAADRAQSMAAARAFYEAVGDADTARAVSLVVPERRAQGDLSARHLQAFTSGLAQPLRLTGVQAVGPSLVEVRYQFIASGGRLCSGSATVSTVRRGDAVLINGIRAADAC